MGFYLIMALLFGFTVVGFVTLLTVSTQRSSRNVDFTDEKNQAEFILQNRVDCKGSLVKFGATGDAGDEFICTSTQLAPQEPPFMEVYDKNGNYAYDEYDPATHIGKIGRTSFRASCVYLNSKACINIHWARFLDNQNFRPNPLGGVEDSWKRLKHFPSDASGYACCFQ
jgi:hypothetical protein